tara:strand:- start:175 stop:429 length:255 start_codon:yes stop_codon:yes gene_type:complete
LYPHHGFADQYNLLSQNQLPFRLALRAWPDIVCGGWPDLPFTPRHPVAEGGKISSHLVLDRHELWLLLIAELQCFDQLGWLPAL